MAKVRFRKPSIAAVMGEVITLAVWLFFGDRVIDVLDELVGDTFSMNVSDVITNQQGCTNASVFEDAFEILGIGYDCSAHTVGQNIQTVANSDNGLLGIVALVMVVMILMNFITYR